MDKPKIVIFRGKNASGKTTAINNLRKSRKMKDWILINHGELKHWFDNLLDAEKKPLRKEAMWAILRTIIKSKKRRNDEYKEIHSIH